MAERRRKFFLWSATTVLILVTIFSVTIFSFQRAYAGKIYPNVHLSDLDLAGKTKTQADFLIKSRLREILDKDTEFTAGDKSITVKLSDTGLSYDVNDLVTRSYAIGRSGSFIDNIKSITKTIIGKTEITITPTIDQTKFDDFVKIAIGQLSREPVDATISVENGVVKSSAAESGQVIDTTGLADKIATGAITSNKIELSSTVKQPTLGSADFSQAEAQANSILKKQVVFNYLDKSYRPSVTDIGNWISFSNVNNIISASLDSAKVQAYLNNIAHNFEVKKVDTKINSQTGEVIQQGQEGLYLDKNKAYDDLVARISGEVISINLVVNKQTPAEIKVTVAEGVQTGRFEGKYLDVDLTNQKLCRIEGTNLLDCFIISSGKASKPTPIGTFAIQNKDPRRWSTTYGLWMPYWQQFADGGYGLHELPEWPNGYKEGQDHLGTPVSHGCVRMGVGTAELVYNWTEVGTPVYIHK